MGEIYNSIQCTQIMITTIPWWLWIVLLGFGMVLLIVDGLLLQKENIATDEMNQIYRWNFDIRLGMYSPE